MAIPKIELIIQCPDWLPHSYDASGANLVFVKVTREDHGRLAFLSSNELRRGFEFVSVPAAPLQSLATEQRRGPLHFIFHTAFCCSTLLINALAVGDHVLGMKEPDVLVNLTHRLMKGEIFEGTGRLSLVLGLLARPFDGTEAIVVKPSCFANPLLGKVLRQLPDARAILLHSSVRTFLYAVAKRGPQGRVWGRRVFESALQLIPIEQVHSSSLARITDLQAAGLAWLMRRNQFNHISKEFGACRVIQLNGEQLVATPVDTIESVLSHFQLKTMEPKAFEHDRVFGRYSKEPRRRFDSHLRALERAELIERYGNEVEIIANWVEEMANQQGIDLMVHSHR